MNLKKIGAIVAVTALASAAFAGEEIHRKMSVEVVGDSDADGIRFELDSDELGFNLHDLQVGENRSVVDKDGRNILITREENGYRFDVDGKTVKMPAFDHVAEHSVWVDDGDISRDIDVHVMRDAKFIRSGEVGVTIISGKPIDEATQQAIQPLLETAGHEANVNFIDRESGHGGPHRIKMIETRVEESD